MATYTAAQQMAKNLLKKFGSNQQSTIQTQDGTLIKGYAVLLNQTKSNRDGTTTTSSNKTVLFSGKDKAEPADGDIITIGKKVFAIVSVENLTPDGITTILFKLEVTA